MTGQLDVNTFILKYLVNKTDYLPTSLASHVILNPRHMKDTKNTGGYEVYVWQVN